MKSGEYGFARPERGNLLPPLSTLLFFFLKATKTYKKDEFLYVKGDYMKRSKEELQQEHILKLSINLKRINSSLSAYPSLVQPKFIIEYFKEKKTNSILCYQYASFIRDSYEQLYKMHKNKKYSFTRKVTGKKDKTFDVPYSFGDYLCIKDNKMFKIIRQGFFDMEKINKLNTFSVNNEFHLDLFDPETKSLSLANDKCAEMVLQKSPDMFCKDEIFAFAVNQFYIKTFGWQDGIILSQILYWIKTNKRETIFFSDREFSKKLYMDRRTIINSKIWSQDFVTKEKTGDKFKIRIDLDKLVFFIKGVERA